jgi:hypothetical protein
MEEDMRKQIDMMRIDHPVMPIELAWVGNDVSIMTGKSGSQSQMLMDDIAVILTAALKAGVKPDDLAKAFGEVDPRNEPVTRSIVKALNDDGANEEEADHACA